jgi:hypothetical protein
MVLTVTVALAPIDVRLKGDGLNTSGYICRTKEASVQRIEVRTTMVQAPIVLELM